MAACELTVTVNQRHALTMRVKVTNEYDPRKLRFADVDVAELRAQADASMPAASNNNVNSHYIL